MAGEKAHNAEPLIRDISDTARWVAWYRAMETMRDDAVFRDPYARKLAGERGAAIAKAMKHSTRHSWSFVARTYLFDHFILEQIGMGCDMVVNLACGLDARPYRMNIPPEVKWVEVDLPGILDYKEEVLKGDKPGCCFERVRTNLGDRAARRELFARLASQSKYALIVTEGLITYFSEEEVGNLAQDLAEQKSFRRWVTDLASPKLLQMIKKSTDEHLERAGSPIKFAPVNGPKFFEQYGWKAVAVKSLLPCGKKIKRLPGLMNLMALLPDPQGRNPRAPWSGVVMLGR